MPCWPEVRPAGVPVAGAEPVRRFSQLALGLAIVMTPIAGRIAGPMLGPYHAAKFGLVGLAGALRAELAPWGIRVILIEPGAIVRHAILGENSKVERNAVVGGAFGPGCRHRVR